MKQLAEIIQRNVSFIAWENFTHPKAYGLWFSSLCLCILFIWVCVSIGKILTRRVRYANHNEELILNFAAGSAGLSFLIAFLALSHLLNKTAVSIVLLTILLAYTILEKEIKAILKPLQLIGSAFKEEKWLYLLFLMNSLPALLPPYRVDEMSYYLPYVKEWVEAGGITINPAMIFPIYTFNFQMLQSLGMMLDSVPLVHLLSWISGCFACLTILIFLRRLKVWEPIAYCSALAFYLSPLTQRYLTIGHLDVPLMFYMVVSVFGIYFSRQTEEMKRFYLPSALICAMFIGMKVTGLFFIPLFLMLAAIGQKRKHWLVFGIIFLAFGSIWYLRNFIIAGDPISPAMNMLLERPDPFWVPEDYQMIAQDITRGLSKNFTSIASLPLHMLTSTIEGPLRDWPFQGFILIFPLSLLTLIPLLKRRSADAVVATWYAIVIWISTSYLIRYAHFAALAAVCSGLFLSLILDRFKIQNLPLKTKWVCAAVVAFLLIGPNANALRYFKNNFNKPIPLDEKTHTVFYRYLGIDAIHLIQKLSPLGIRGTIYSFGYTHLRSYYQSAGFQVIGYYVHPFPYRDFKESLIQGEIYQFLKSAGVNAMVINQETLKEFDLTEDQVLHSVRQHRKLEIPYHDAASIVIKVG